MHPMQPKKYKFGQGDAAFLNRCSAFAEHRNVQPTESVSGTRRRNRCLQSSNPGLEWAELERAVPACPSPLQRAGRVISPRALIRGAFEVAKSAVCLRQNIFDIIIEVEFAARDTLEPAQGTPPSLTKRRTSTSYPPLTPVITVVVGYLRPGKLLIGTSKRPMDMNHQKLS